MAVMQGTASQKRGASRGGRRKPSTLVRVLVGLLIVIAVGGASFLIGYLIGLQLGLLAPGSGVLP